MKDIERFMEWFRDKDNLANLRTGTTGLFIIVFVVYFYGFRTDFEITVNDLADIVIDMMIVVVSAFAIINDFSMRGVQAEINEDNEELNKLINQHYSLTKELDEDKVHNALIAFNKQEDKKVMEKKKRNIVKSLKRKRRKHDYGSRKFKKITKRIDHYENPETYVKFKRRHITVDDLIKRGAMKKANKEISVAYSPHKDTLTSQSGMVFVMVIFTSLMRVALDPSWAALGEALIFLSWLIPFLLIRAVLSYEISRKNTKDNYPIAIIRQINTIKWCNNYKGEPNGAGLQSESDSGSGGEVAGQES